MPTPEDKPSKKRKNSTSELAEHEPVQKKKPPDDEIPAFLKNVPLETLMKAIGDRKEPSTYQGVVYEPDDVLGDTWLNNAGAIFVPLDENNL